MKIKMLNTAAGPKGVLLAGSKHTADSNEKKERFRGLVDGGYAEIDGEDIDTIETATKKPKAEIATKTPKVKPAKKPAGKKPAKAKGKAASNGSGTNNKSGKSGGDTDGSKKSA